MSTFAAALAHAQRGEFAAAETILTALVKRERKNADALHLLANVLHAKGDREGALAAYARAAKLAPRDPGIAFNHAAVLAAAERHAEAADAYARALTLKPGDAEALLGRGASLAALLRYADALACYDAASAAGLDRPDLHANRGACLAALKRHDEALAACDRALAAAPNDTKSLFNRGAALVELERPAEAVATLDTLLALAPSHAVGRAARGTALALLGRFDEAIAEIDAALALQPERTDLWARRGFALTVANRADEALAAYDRVLAATPDDTEAAYAKADALLSAGDFAHGLPYYETRLRTAKPFPPTAAPLWTGAEALGGKSILVQGEQGFGDLFQFSRFIPLLAAQGARVILQERRPTLGLMRSLAGVDTLIANDEPAPHTDFRIPLCSLLHALNLRLDSIPASVPYLHAEPERVARWRERLGPAPKRRIGVAWAGGVSQVLQRARRLDAPALDRLLSADADFVSLQMNDGAEAALIKAHGALSFGDATADFAELAALIDTLDLVVSIDTGVAHLAGALGKPVLIMLPFYADWRWLRGRSDTPWYPTARLFRQRRFGDWTSVIDEVVAALQ